MLIALGLILIWRKRRHGMSVAVFGLVTLLLLSSPYVSRQLVLGLEHYPPLSPEQVKSSGAAAIVIMGGGRYSVSPEYGGDDTVSDAALVRLRFGARVQRATGLPVLVTGGRLNRDRLSEAELMKKTLMEDFDVPVRWVEQQALNSAENAIYSRVILQKEGISNIVLVTHVVHMARSVAMFERQGFTVTAAGTRFSRRRPGHEPLSAYLPSVHALASSRESLHEYLGLLWYAIRY